jgi:K+-sensing histidine kinase KdpD
LPAHNRETTAASPPGTGTRGSQLVGDGRDTNLLFEAVGNLVDNALKFPPRSGCVTLRGVRGEATIGIEVVDTGAGIPRSPMTRCCGDFIARKRAGTHTEVVWDWRWSRPWRTWT